MANIKNAVKLGVFTLAIMNVTAVVSLRQMFCKCTNKGENIWICDNKVLPLLLTKR